jgi:hypothetical protein
MTTSAFAIRKLATFFIALFLEAVTSAIRVTLRFMAWIMTLESRSSMVLGVKL